MVLSTMKTISALLCLLPVFSPGLAADDSFDPGWDLDLIINGDNADIKKYPYVVGILYNDQYTCGGSIINENWVLTAAHCLFETTGDPREASSFAVVSGQSDITQGVRTQVSDVIRHPKFVYNIDFTDDIALLQLATALTMDATTQPALLPPPMKDLNDGTPVSLLGWGFTSTTGNPSKVLKVAQLKTFDQGQCSSLYSKQGKTVRTSEMCAMAQGQGQCNGDSGGPLVATLPRGAVQVGVVSFSQKPCANKIYPGVFTRVSYYIDFIRQYTG